MTAKRTFLYYTYLSPDLLPYYRRSTDRTRRGSADLAQQIEVANDIATQISTGENRIIGIMIESNLVEGNQKVDDIDKIQYGKSITDACIGWEDTENVIDLFSKCEMPNKSERTLTQKKIIPLPKRPKAIRQTKIAFGKKGRKPKTQQRPESSLRVEEKLTPKSPGKKLLQIPEKENEDFDVDRFAKELLNDEVESFTF